MYRLAEIHSVEAMIEWGKEKDTGLDLYHLAVAMDSMDRHARDQFPVDDDTLGKMKDFFSIRRADLIQRSLDGA